MWSCLVARVKQAEKNQPVPCVGIKYEKSENLDSFKPEKKDLFISHYIFSPTGLLKMNNKKFCKASSKL